MSARFASLGWPMLWTQIMAPASSIAYTSFPLVTTKYAPLPAGPFSKYRGDAQVFPMKLPVKVASFAIRAASAFVRVG